MKFIREKVSSLMGHTEVRYTANGYDFQIVSSPMGVQFKGTSPMLENHMDLDRFAKIVSEAWTDHKALRPKLDQTLTGH